MSNELVVALVTGAFSVLAVWLTNRKAASDMDAKLAQQQAVFETFVNGKLEVLTGKVAAIDKKVDAHNKLVERTYKLEANDALQDAEMKRINKRLEGLENGNSD